MFLLLSLVLSSGCISTYLNDETIGADGKVTKEVTFYRGGFVTATTFDNASINYQGVQASIGNYSNKGDAELIKKIAKAALFIATAIQTGGTAPALSSVVQAISASSGGEQCQD
jgi:hypothetical protein